MKQNCAEARAKMYEYLDREVGMYRRWKIRRHLRRCPPCEDGFETKLKGKIREHCVDEVPEELYERLRTFLRENKADGTVG